MGPALIEPDHVNLARITGLDRYAAMGPALIEPDHVLVWGVGWVRLRPPQWGRL